MYQPVPPNTDTLLSCFNQFCSILTQYHHISTSTALSWPSTNQYRPILTQYHHEPTSTSLSLTKYLHVSTSTALYWPNTTKYQTVPPLFWLEPKYIFPPNIFLFFLPRFSSPLQNYNFSLQIFSSFLLLSNGFIFFLQIFKCQTFLGWPEMSTVVR